MALLFKAEQVQADLLAADGVEELEVPVRQDIRLLQSQKGMVVILPIYGDLMARGIDGLQRFSRLDLGPDDQIFQRPGGETFCAQGIDVMNQAVFHRQDLAILQLNLALFSWGDGKH